VNKVFSVTLSGLLLLNVLMNEGAQAASLPPPVSGNETASGIASELGNIAPPPPKNTGGLMLPAPQRASRAHFSSTGKGAFVLRSVQLEGSHVLVPLCATNLIQSVKNKMIDFQGVQALAGQLEDCYREAGYILNQVVIPPQKISQTEGRLLLKVVDGHLSGIEVVGDSPKGARKQLQRYLDQIQSMNPFNFKQTERYLLLANDIPGLTVKGRLRADPAHPATSILQVNVQRKAYSGLLNVNNRGSQYIGPNQALAQVNFNDLLAADTLQLSVAKTLPHTEELNYFAGSYALQLGKEGTQLTASEIYTRTQPGGGVYNSLGLEGTYNQVGLGVTQPLIRSLVQNLSVLANAYHTSNISSYTSVQAFNDQITGLQVGANYQLLALGGSTQAQGLVTQGLPFNGNQSNDPSRNNAVENFTHFNLTASHLRYLSQRFSTLLMANAQYSADSLPVSEQLGYGGSLYGLAYQPSELTGDSGIIGSASLRYDLPLFSIFQQIQPFISYDVGDLWTNSPAVGQNTSTSGSSAAFGFNLAFKGGFQGSIMLAKPLTTAPSNDTNKNLECFFNLSWLF